LLIIFIAMAAMAEADLVEQGLQERHAADAETGDDATEDRDVEGAGVEQVEAQHRIGHPTAMQVVRAQQCQRDRKQPENRAEREAVFAEDFEHVG
jgi:hypothetical protein